MKVILTTDVPKIGQKDDVKDFNDGFAQNVLLSKGKAILATPKALADLANKKDSLRKKKEEEAKAFASLISSLNNQVIRIKVKTNEKGSLFKSITESDVSKSIKEQFGLAIEEKDIIMDHFKQIGNHKITIKRGQEKGECEIVIGSSN